MLVFLIKQEILREYKRFAEVENNLRETEWEDYQSVLCALRSTDVDVVPISKAIAFLSELASRHYNKNPLILIDEYNTPMTSAYSEGCYDKLRLFFTSLYGSALKGNPYLETGNPHGYSAHYQRKYLLWAQQSCRLHSK